MIMRGKSWRTIKPTAQCRPAGRYQLVQQRKFQIQGGNMADAVAIAARFEIEVRDLAYQHQDGAPLLARLYRPIGAEASTRPFPGLIDVHGGAWASGDRLNNAPLDEALAKSGIVVLAIDFRMPPAWRYPASIADVNLATRWLKAHAGEFGSRRELVGGLGTSSGGHQPLLSVLPPEQPPHRAP